MKQVRIAVLQRVCATYRLGLFSALAAKGNVSFKLFVGQDLPGTKVKGSADFGDFPAAKLDTRFIKVGRRVFPFHAGLVHELKKFRPTAILCEGESHFLGYLQAIYYRWRHDRSVALIHWCYYALPFPKKGEQEGLFPRLAKASLRKCFDAFLSYSSFGKERLIAWGEEERKVFVATNVGPVEKYVERSKLMNMTKAKARKELGIRDGFAVLYVGSLGENKCPEILLDLARECAGDCHSFIIVGTGEREGLLRNRVMRERLENVYIAGQVTGTLPLYFRAADVLMMPGRGGIVISEAMAFGLPVVVHAADGTEYDLVENWVTGIRVTAGGVDDFREALEKLRADPDMCSAMGAASQRLVSERCNTDNMARQILRATEFAQGTN